MTNTLSPTLRGGSSVICGLLFFSLFSLISAVCAFQSLCSLHRCGDIALSDYGVPWIQFVPQWVAAFSTEVE